MDTVYEEKGEAKAEIERVKEELRDKRDLKVKKHEQELFRTEDEINDAKQTCEYLKQNLDNEESIIKHISSAANDTPQADCEEKFKKLEDEKRLEFASQEANEKVEKQEQEIGSLIGCLSVSNMCMEIKEDEMLQNLEEENMKADEQLKWKGEQFKHLEEAHEKHKDQFMSGKNEWELEKSALLDEISSLQKKLESHIRISQDLQNQLHMCKQSFSHEESQRKCLEVEYPIYSLKTKEEYYEESKSSIEKLEQENHELRMSLKELQESGASYSESKLLSELRNLEQIHKECDSTFKVIKAEWSFQVEQLTGTINSLLTELENKTAAVEKLEMELESSNSLTTEMTLLNEELSVMVLVFQQGISETKLKLANYEDKMETKEAALMGQIESYAPAKEMLEESTKCQLLPKENVLHMEFDLEEKLREVCDDLDKANIQLNETIYERNDMELELHMWMSYVERLGKDLEENLVMRQRLENSLLAQVDFSERLKQEKDRLISEKETRINCLQHVLLEQKLEVRDTEGFVPIAVSSKTGEVRYLQMIEEENKILEELREEVYWLEQESFRREVESGVIAEIKMEKFNKFGKENHINGENTRIDELMQQVTALEQHCTSSLTTISSQLDEKQAEINQVQEVCDKIKAAEILSALESKQLAWDIEAEMNEKQFKTKDLTCRIENNMSGSDDLLQKLKMENRNLQENVIRLSSEKENLLLFIRVLYDKMCDSTTADTEIIEMLVQSFENNGPAMKLIKGDEFLVKENMIIHSPTGIKKHDIISDIRSPFQELNILLEG
ncbi:hypothetical protein TanjilG_15989 [Lupinus angustifolius]|uniref:Uncharacterized protein n=1 Tax=Lupinus angustifolius TaxID=3871 RepID=A0A4P1RH30_LUPAN|nr:PREDICTED: uncharacterized protein At4g38062-like [Lupinus angustifolius]OIW10617.1 hypothetical protein TanjilG_15989 [Lupinus angustifolius]